MTVVAYDFAIVVDVDWAHKTPRKLKLIELQSALTNAEALPNTRTDRQAGQSHTHTHTLGPLGSQELPLAPQPKPQYILRLPGFSICML